MGRRPALGSLVRGMVLAGIVATGPAAPGVLAQEQEQQRAVSPFRDSTPPPRTFAVTFGGGSLREYVKAIREAAGDIPVNVMLTGDEDSLVLPEIVLEQVTVENAVEALGFVRTESSEVSVYGTGQGDEQVFAVNVQARRAAAERNTAIDSTDEPSFEVFSLARLLEAPADEEGGPTADISTMLTAIDTAMEMAGGGDATEIKFHPDSGLLIVKGDQRETKIVANLINELYSDVTRRRSELRDLKNQLSEAATRVQAAEVQLHAQRGELEIARTQLEQMEKMREGGFVGEAEVSQASVRIQQLTGEMEVREIELQQKQERVAALHSQIEALRARSGAPSSADAIRAEISRLEEQLAVLREKLANMEGRKGAGQGGR